MNEIRLCTVYVFGDMSGKTLIITKDNTRYYVDNDKVYSQEVKEFIADACEKRNVLYLGLGNKLYYGDKDVSLVESIIKRFENEEYPTAQMYKYWKEYI